jgi:hypothetical protein
MLGVGGTSEVVWMKLRGANPGVCMLNPGGFLLAVLSVSRRGEFSVDKLFMPSTPEEVDGRVNIVGVGFKDNFLTLRAFSEGWSGCALIDERFECDSS